MTSDVSSKTVMGFWGKNCMNIMVIMVRLNTMFKYIFMDGITIKNGAKAFYIHVWKDHDLFNFIISNRGRPFVNHFWEQLITRLGISANFSTTYHTEIDGQTEIMNSVFEEYFRTYINYFPNDWVFWLPSTEFVINNHASETKQCIFFSTNSGQHYKLGLRPDPFINKPMDFREKTDKNIANFFVEKLVKINEIFKNKWFSFKPYMNIIQMSINKTFPIMF